MRESVARSCDENGSIKFPELHVCAGVCVCVLVTACVRLCALVCVFISKTNQNVL